MIFYSWVRDMEMFELLCCTYVQCLKDSVSQYGLYVHVTLSKRSYDSTPIMNPDESTPENISHFHSHWHDLSLWSCALSIDVPSCDALSFFLFLFIASSASSRGKSYWMDVWVVDARECFCRSCCYLLATDRAMNSGAKAKLILLSKA